MCYSAMVEQDHRAFLRAFPEARIGLREFASLIDKRLRGQSITLSKAMEHSFLTSNRADDAEIAARIREYRVARAQELQTELAHQKERAEKAAQELEKKETRKWLETLRIASTKVKQYTRQLADLEREELLPKDSRIYPKGYAPVLVEQDGQLVVLPMRYLLRPQGVPASFDAEKEGSYNARRDNLTRFWKKQFRATRGIVLMQAFYEHVNRHDFERRLLQDGEKAQNAIVEFRPEDEQTLYVACIWSHWTGEGDDLHSFAVITDDPPAEVRAAGHDRCVVQIRKERVREWLSGQDKTDDQLMSILNDRPAVTYRGRLAASD